MDPQDYGFLVTLCICGIVLFAIIGLFCILRRAFKKFYEARQYFDSEDPSLQLPQGTFSWLVPFFKKFDFQEILYTHGVDAYIYLRFVRTTLIVLIIIAILGCAILFPINYVGKNKDADPSSDVYVDGLDILSMANVENGSHLLWAHVVFTFLVTIIVCAAFWWEYREYFRVRKMYKRRVIPSNFSVIVRGIPIAECNPDTLMHFLDNVTPLRPLISEVQVYYLTPELDHLLELREKALQNLESAQEKTRRKGSDPGVRHGMLGLFGPQEPAVPFYTRQIATYENQIRNLQIRVPSPTQPPSGVAFITFSSQKAAQMVSQVILSRKYPRHWQVFPAPEPNDVNWNQLEEGLHTHTMRTALTHLLTFMVVFFWSIPVFFLAGLANLDTLSKIKGLRFLVDLLEKSDWLAGFIQGFLPNLVLIIFMATVSAIMHAITKIQGIYSKSLVDKSTLLKYHFFLICNVLLVYTIGGSIFSFLDRIIDSPKEIFSLLASSLPMQATQFTNYVLLTGFVWHLLELLRPHILIGSLIKKHLLCSSANQCKQAMNPGQFDYTEYYAKNLLIFTIAIVYSTMNPLILLPAVAYFGLGLFIHSYNIKYVYLTNYEGGGLIWPSIFRRVIAALIIFQLLMIGVFNLKRIPGATAIIVQVVLTLYFGQRCEQIFKKKAHFGVLDDEAEPLLPDALRGAYLQPSLRRLEEEPAENLEEVTELPVEEKEKMGDDKVIVKLTFRPSDF